MKTPLSVEEIAGHEGASLSAIDDELCHGAALKIAQRTANQAQVGNVTRRYELIAQALCSLRPKPLSKEQRERAEQTLAACNAERPTEAEISEGLKLREREETELRSLFNDARREGLITLNEKLKVEGELDELLEPISARRDALLEEWFGARLASGYWPTTTANRLLRRIRRDGKAKFRRWLERVIRRYHRAKEHGESWVTPLGLLHLLAVEWRRDEKALWEFLSACFKCWDDLANNPQSDLRKKILLHQIATQTGHNWPEMLKRLQKMRVSDLPKVAVGEAGSVTTKDDLREASRGQDKLLASLRQMSSRDVRSALKAKIVRV